MNAYIIVVNVKREIHVKLHYRQQNRIIFFRTFDAIIISFTLTSEVGIYFVVMKMKRGKIDFEVFMQSFEDIFVFIFCQKCRQNYEEKLKRPK